jgi:hypothetical protein
LGCEIWREHKQIARAEPPMPAAQYTKR